MAVVMNIFTLLSTPALASNNEAMLGLLKILHDKGSIDAQEYLLLRNAALADGEKAEGKVNEMQANLDNKTKDLPKINTKGKLEFSQGDNTFRIGGRLMADTTVALGEANLASEGGHVVTEFRRARMYLSGTLQRDWTFKFQYEFSGQSAAASTDGIRDATIAYTGLSPLTITLGHQVMPLSLNEITSSKYITFIERSQPLSGIVADVGGNRQYALSAQGYFRDRFTAAAAVHVGTANEDTEEDAYGFTGRLTFSPIHERTRAVHLGIGLDRSDRKAGGFNIDGEPEIHPGKDILENEARDYTSATTFVAEAAGLWGPFSVQGEYAASKLSDSPTLESIDASAWYVYGSYYLTGESRHYDWKKGAFGQTRVRRSLFQGGPGAWEVALRYTSGDFENASDPVVSSRADILTAGLNWYPGNNVRFSANYVNVLDASPAADAELAGDLDAESTADDADYFIFRGQWYF